MLLLKKEKIYTLEIFFEELNINHLKCEGLYKAWPWFWEGGKSKITIYLLKLKNGIIDFTKTQL